MAEKDVLSQEEIDALLESVDEKEEETAAPIKAEPTEAETEANEETESTIATATATASSAGSGSDGKVTTLNFTGQERLVKGQLPVLEKIHERVARYFNNEIYNLTAAEFEIKQDPLQVIKHKEFMSSLPNPSLMSIYKFKPLRGKGLIIFDNVFVYDLVDYYFGGSSQFLAQKDRSDYTATELRVMDVVVKKLVANITQAWRSIQVLDITKFSDDTNPQLVNIAEAEEMLLVTRFNLNFGKEVGCFYIVIPYSMVEPIKQQLELGASRPDDEIDPNWIKSLKEELMDVELTVSAAMAKGKATFDQVVHWKEGDFIPMEIEEVVTLDIEGIPSFTATVGSAGEKRALKIIKNISYRG